MFLHLFHISLSPKNIHSKEMAKQEALIFPEDFERGMRRKSLSLICRGCWRHWTAAGICSLSKLILKQVSEC